jgi:Acetyltransferase (GNAT) domain
MADDSVLGARTPMASCWNWFMVSGSRIAKVLTRRHGLTRESAIRIDVLRSKEQICLYRKKWQELCQHRDADPAFFDFILSTRPEAAPYILFIHSDSTEAFVVGRLETSRLETRVGYWAIHSPRLRILELIHGGLIGPIDSPVASVICTYLRGLLRRAEVDAIRLHYADVAHPLFDEFCRLRGPIARLLPIRQVPHRRRVIDPSVIPYESKRANKRREKRLHKTGGGDVRIERYESVGVLPELLISAEEAAKRSYQRGLGVGFSRNDAVERRLELLATLGWLRAWVLYLGNKPAAFWIGTLRQGSFLSDYLAYDSELSYLAPGSYLTTHVIGELQLDSSCVRSIDFGVGDATYKQRFATEVRMTAIVDVFALTWRGTSAAVIRAVAGLVSISGKAALKRLGSLEVFKKRQRQRAADLASERHRRDAVPALQAPGDAKKSGGLRSPRADSD